MANYTNVIKLDSFPSFEVNTGYKPAIRLDSFPSFEVFTGFKPAVKIIYYEEDRPRSGQINPRRL